MPVLLGPFDPLKLILNTLNHLMQKGLISVDEAKGILLESMDPNMSDKEKNKIVDGMVEKG